MKSKPMVGNVPGMKRFLPLALSVAAVLAGCAGQPVHHGEVPPTPAGVPERPASADVSAEDPARVQPGDLATVNFTLASDNGVAVRPDVPETVVAGGAGAAPGLSDAVLGMSAGEKKQVVVPAGKGYGLRDPAKVRQFPAVRRMPKTVRIPAADYVKQFGAFPLEGREVALSPYLKARVTSVTETDAELLVLAKDGERFEDPLGAVECAVSGEEVTIRFIPRTGVPFPGPQGEPGFIVASDNDTFTVDFNHPLAGKTLTLQVEALSLVKASSVNAARIPWIESTDGGLGEAKRVGKPVVLVLYADWCGWCRKLFGESLQDPRNRMLSDRFVWAKVNSDRDKAIYGKYGQNGFPLVLLLDPDGKVVRRLEGYRDGAALYGELSGFLKDREGRKG